MSADREDKRIAPDSLKEKTRMPKRLATLAALIGATVLLLAAPPVAPASAASPWWQVLTGSRPTNLWEPKDASETQEVKTTKFFGLIAAAEVEVNGSLVGCLGTGSLAAFGGPSADELCEAETGFPASETAAEFEAMLEGPYGPGVVEVTGGPVGALPFELKSPWLPAAVKVTVIQHELFGQTFPMGTASAEITSEGSGRLVLTLTNLGDAAVDGTATPVRIVDQLPEGLAAYDVVGVAGAEDVEGPVECAVEPPDEVACRFEGELPPYEAIEVEVFANLTGSPPVAGAPGEVSVSGGNATSASAVQTVKVSSERVPFGVEQFSVQAEEEGGAIARRSGSHPFQFTTTLQLNSGAVTPGDRRDATVEQPALPRNLRSSLPAGLVGNAAAMPQCDMKSFLNSTELINACPDESAVGVSSVTIVEPANTGLVRVAVPVFNLTPAHGEPARFGFTTIGVPVVIDTALDPEDHNRIVASVHNIRQIAEFLSSTLTLWGTPGDPRHDNARGWRCVYKISKLGGACERPANLSETPLLRLPVSCNAPLDFGLELEPWNVPIGSVVDSKPFSGEPLRGCNQVPFDPTIAAAPTSMLAANPSGLDFRLDMPNSGLLSKDAIAEGQAKKVEVTLPEGMTVNPSEGEGLVGCSPAQYAAETASSLSGEGCPEASKVGTVQISTPLLVEEAHGSLYVATPHDNPSGSLIALYMVAKIPERGILVKQAGKVEADPVTGQLTTTFDDLPQIPFTTFKLHFREGGRAPLVTPPACGKYDVVAKFTPWSAADPDNPAPSEVVTRTSSFEVERGVDGGACPSGGLPPFHPGLLAGTINNAAGHYSPFNLRLSRKDGEQEFTHFSIKLPPGVVGKLAGVPFCSDAAIAAAKARTGPNGGAEELASPSCPAASEVGRTLVGAGVGASLTYVPGKVYLAGPYHGSALSIVSITAAKVGPFDLGTVVVRAGLKVNPDTAEVFVDATGSDPIPHIIQGIVVHARDIRVYVDRPEFVLNPTSCERTSTASTVLGSGLDFGSAADDQPVTVTSPFQAADCASLGFKPKLALTLKGGTKRGDTPRFKAVLTARKGDANVGAAQVTLPHSEFLEQAHIKTVCTRVQFAAGGGNGEQCPPASIYGHAKAVTPLLDEPLVGPVYLRSSSHELPDLVAALHSGKIDINLDGHIDSIKNGRIRNTFEAVPDAPVTRFTLEMQGGKKGLLVNSTNLCKSKHRAIAAFTGQNGKRHDFNPLLKVRCGGKSGKHKEKAPPKRHRAG
jgi:hypothetical protein